MISGAQLESNAATGMLSELESRPKALLVPEAGNTHYPPPTTRMISILSPGLSLVSAHDSFFVISPFKKTITISS